jgi:hypothetical protein
MAATGSSRGGVDEVVAPERARMLQLGGHHVHRDDGMGRHQGAALDDVEARRRPRPKTAMLAPGGTAAVLITAPTPVITEQPTSAARSSGMAGSMRMAQDS